ncbi:MAG: hypothetical protein AABY65_03100 [Nitrospirota bacterium]|jgi:hypothetical protein
MATVNFSVPDKIKEAFNKAFAGENKSAVLSRLMKEAVGERERRRRRVAAIAAVLAIRRTQRPVSEGRVRQVRVKGRP